MVSLKQTAAVLLWGVLLYPAVLFAMDVPDGVTVVAAPEVRMLTADEGAVLIHTLSRIEYRMQHIPGSVNVPVDEIASSPNMPQDRNAAIILYCNGLACPYSRRAAEQAVDLGYKRVYWFRGGILEWRKYQYPMQVDEELKNVDVPKLSPDEFLKHMQETENILVLDVRPQWWRQSKEQAGIIPGTEMMIPLLRLDQNLDLIPRDRPIILVDRLMRQSVHAAKFLNLNGFDLRGVLKGGSRRWVLEGRPVVPRDEEPTFAGRF